MFSIEHLSGMLKYMLQGSLLYKVRQLIIVILTNCVIIHQHWIYACLNSFFWEFGWGFYDLFAIGMFLKDERWW